MKKVFLLLAVLWLATSCDLDGYGPKVATNGVEVYYKPDAMKEKAKRFSVMLDTIGYGAEGDVSFQIIKDSIVHINMVTKDEYHTDTSLDYSLSAVAMLSSMEIFTEESVQLHLCDEQFNRKRSLDKITK